VDETEEARLVALSRQMAKPAATKPRSVDDVLAGMDVKCRTNRVADKCP
jgi:hypothetical protein